MQMQGEIILSMLPSDIQMIDTANDDSFISGELSILIFNMLFYEGNTCPSTNVPRTTHY